MIEHAKALLAMETLPTWQDDAPLRRELESLRDDVRAYTVAAGYDAKRAAIKADQVRERTDRINAFIAGRRCGGHQHNGWGFRP